MSNISIFAFAEQTMISMKYLTLTFVVSLLMLQAIMAQTPQEEALFFTGAVMDSKKLTALPYASFQINNKESGNADVSGKFSFKVHVGDTIHYSFVGYRDIHVVIHDSLKQKAYLFGVFMTRDTIALEEVVILPRFNNFKDAFIHSNINTPEYVRATNNVNSAVYQALTTRLTPETKLDAKANTDMLLRTHTVEIEYKGMVSPQQMVGVSTMRTIPEIKRLRRKRKLKIPTNIITDKEIKLLKRMGQKHHK